MQVRDAMVHWDKLVIATPSDTVINAMEKMVKHSVGSVIVTQVKNKAIGIITNQDIMIEILRSGSDGLETTLNKIMSTNLITIDESESLNEAIHKMEESRTHHLIVT
ncbi:MAG: CBS domain-containing protein, partial [Candidatus Heimdallarchaeota archaeon]|nr:CBS domain-containing protein [Candidatus Heimdallarchaeota archaeon]